MYLSAAPFRRILTAAVVAVGFAALSAGLSPVSAQQKPKASPPVLVTSIGQSLDAFQVQLVVKRAGVKYTYDAHAEPDALDDVKTLFLAVGASKKGFGDAGITINDELERTKHMIENAEKKGIFIVVLHMGGEERRDQLSDQLIDVAAPHAKYLIIREDSDADGKFAGIAKAKGIPLEIVDSVINIKPLLDGLFAGV
jgi:hypothetical protein